VDFVRIAQPRLTHVRRFDMTGMTIDSSYHSAVPTASCAPRGESIMFGNVLVGVDGTSAGRDASALGDVLRDRDGRLTLAHVSVSNSATYLSFDTAARRAESLDMLERERAEAGANADVRHVTSLSVARGLRQLAEISAADLLVVGSSSRGSLARWFLGDDTRAALSGASCAVAVAPGGYAERPGPISRIGVAYNGTPESETALAVARGLAARCGGSVRALLVVSPVPRGVAYWEAFEAYPGAGVAEVMQAARDRLRLLEDVDSRIAVGVPSETLAAFGAEVDLLVVGSRSYGPVRRMMLGSTSLQLARAARCPLLVLPRALSVHHEQSLVGSPPADLTDCEQRADESELSGD
jgi:nucleotide-binding universal stress UspA family protein